MSGYFDDKGNYVESKDWSVPDQPNFPLPSASVPTTTAAPTPSNEVNIEDTSMVQSFFQKLANKVTEASDLAKEVQKLREEVRNLGLELQAARDNVEMERAARTEVERKLTDVQQKLDHEQRAVHDLVMERDIVVGERNEAQQARDTARRESDDWQRQYHDTLRLLEQEWQKNLVLEERTNVMADRIKALKDALGGLHNL